MLGTTQRPRRIRSLAVAVATATVFTGAAVAATSGVAMATATNAGLLTFTGASTGTSATTFTLTSSGAACTGNTAYDGTRVQSFIAPLAVDLSTLTFGFAGPITAGVYPLYSSTGTPFINQNTGNPQVGVSPIAGAGVLTGLPTFTLAPLTVTQLPAGTYRAGYACTTNSGATLDKYWYTYINIDGSTNYTKVVSAPAAITGIVAVPQANGTSISVTWPAPTDSGAAAITGYVLWYGSGTSYRLTTSATASATLTGLAKNATYNIIVAASNGTYYSPVQVSAIAQATTLATVPGASGKPVLTKGVKKITLKWTAPADNGGRAITAYRVQRSLNGITWTTLTSAASASTRTYVATGLTSYKKYYFRVAAINPVGVGTYSAAANAIAG